jgi:choline dehydrogenase
MRMDGFDLVIVGGGSAGCALAGRIASRKRWRVALIEAGPDYGPLRKGRWPADLLDARASPDSHDWGYSQTRAKVIGGCSSHNECALVRPLPGDFDRWRIPGWSDADLAPAADFVARALPASASGIESLSAWQRAFLESALEAGYPPRSHADEAPGRPGAGPFLQNLSKGKRINAAFAFLDPVRSRIEVIADFLADRFIFHGSRAVALIGAGKDGQREIRARRFVLCSGVYGSPALLMRSGIGPARSLAKLGIPVRIPSPGVGRNLHDHPGIGLEFAPSPQLTRATRKDAAAGRLYESQIVLRAAPDLHVIPYQGEDGEGAYSYGILAFHLSPRSRGAVELADRDPTSPPRIDINALSDPSGHDLGALMEGMRLLSGLTHEPALARAISKPARRSESDKRLSAFIRANLTAYSHPVGTCRMGNSPRAGHVVGPDLRVHGLDNLFVADASLIPRIPRANTNFACCMIGARAADLLAGRGRDQAGRGG